MGLCISKNTPVSPTPIIKKGKSPKIHIRHSHIKKNELNT